MARQRKTSADDHTPARKLTPTLLLELPLQVTAGQAKRLRAHLEAARQFYQAVLSRCPAAVAPDAGRSRLADSSRYPPQPEAGTAAGLCGATSAVWVFGVRAACRSQNLELCLDRRSPRCGPRPDADHPRLSCPESGMSGPGTPSAGRVAEDGVFPAWRTSVRIPACALCSSGLRRATRDTCRGTLTRCPRSSRGRIRW